MAIYINNPPSIVQVCIEDIDENGTTWVDEYGNLGILVNDEPYLFRLDQLRKYEDIYDGYLFFGITLVDIEIKVKPREI